MLNIKDERNKKKKKKFLSNQLTNNDNRRVAITGSLSKVSSMVFICVRVPPLGTQFRARKFILLSKRLHKLFLFLSLEYFVFFFLFFFRSFQVSNTFVHFWIFLQTNFHLSLRYLSFSACSRFIFSSQIKCCLFKTILRGQLKFVKFFYHWTNKGQRSQSEKKGFLCPVIYALPTGSRSRKWRLKGTQFDCPSLRWSPVDDVYYAEASCI